MYKFNVGRMTKQENGLVRKFDVVFSITLHGKDLDHAHKRVREMIAESGMVSFPVEG